MQASLEAGKQNFPFIAFQIIIFINANVWHTKLCVGCNFIKRPLQWTANKNASDKLCSPICKSLIASLLVLLIWVAVQHCTYVKCILLSTIFHNRMGPQGSPSGSNRIREKEAQSLFPVSTDTQTDCSVWFDPCSVWDTRLFISCICLVQWNSKTAKNWKPSEKLNSLMRWGLAAAHPLFLSFSCRFSFSKTHQFLQLLSPYIYLCTLSNSQHLTPYVSFFSVHTQLFSYLLLAWFLSSRDR